MKKKVFIAITAIFLGTFLVNAQVDTTFEIKLNLKGVTDCKTYVTRFYGGNQTRNEQYEFKNGEVLLKGTTLNPFVARVTFSSNQQFVKSASSGGYYPSKASSLWLIIAPGARFSASGSVENKDFIDFYPTDGYENNALAELNSKMIPLMNEAVNITRDMNNNKTLSADEKKKMEEQESAYSKQATSEKVNFIKSKPNSIAALWIMEDMLIRSEISPLALVPVMAKVDVKKYGKNDFYVSVRDRIEGFKKTSVGNKCPDIQTNDSFDGELFTLKSMKGKYILIDFWGTWCGPCVAGIPKMKAFRDKHPDKLQLLSISNDKDRTKWKAFIEKNQMNWPNILIGSGEKDFVNKFNVQGFPTKILISPLGVILYRESGENEDFYQKVEDLISK